MSRDILIDLTRLAARQREGLPPTGIDRVTLAYLRQYRHRARALVRHLGRWLPLSASSSERLFRALLGESGNPFRDLYQSVATAHMLPARSCHRCLFLHLSHSGLEDPRYPLALEALDLHPVYFVHDLIPLRYPEYSRPGEDQRHGQRVRNMLQTGRGVIFNSRHTARDWESHLQEQGAGSAQPSLVAPLGCEELPPGDSQPPIASPYFLYLGTIEPRKNHLLLLHVWREWQALEGAQVPRLVLLGRRGWECEQVADLLERCPGLQDLVLERQAGSDQEIATWLRHARALVFPSFAEGYGLPLVEALSVGTPVLASDLPAFRESAGAIPDYLHPLDGPGWLAALRDYAHDGPRRRAQMERIRGFRTWRWQDHFQLVDGFLGEILG